MSNKAPNKYLAPVVIAGITIGFLASAYQFIFAQKKPVTQQDESQESTSISEVELMQEKND